MDENPDKWVYHAKGIGAVANIYKTNKKTGEPVLDENGKPIVDERKTQYGLEQGYIDADKYGRLWRSTPRRLRASGA